MIRLHNFVSVSLAGEDILPAAREAVTHATEMPDHRVVIYLPTAGINFEDEINYGMFWLCLTCRDQVEQG